MTTLMLRKRHLAAAAICAVCWTASPGLAQPPPSPVRGIGEPVLVKPGETAASVVAIGERARVEGAVTGDAIALGAHLEIPRSGAVDGAAVSVGGQVWAKEGSAVGGPQLSVPSDWMARIVRAALVDRPDEREVAQLVEQVSEADRAAVGKGVEIGAEEVVAGDVFALDGDIVVKGAVKGSVVAVAGSIALEGDAVVHGNVVALGGETTVPRAGRVGGEVYSAPIEWLSPLVAAAREEMVAKQRTAEAMEATAAEEAEPAPAETEPTPAEPAEEPAERSAETTVRVIPGDQLLMASKYVVEAGEEVQGEAVVMGHPAEIAGVHRGDLTILGGSLRVKEGGSVIGDVVAIGGDVHLSPGAVIDGDVTTVGGRVHEAAGAEVTGDKVPLPLPWLPSVLDPLERVGTWLFNGLALGLLVLLTVLIAPRHVGVIADAMVSRPGESVAVGLAGLLLVLPITVILVLTCVGVLALPFYGAFMAIAVICGWAALCVWLGRVVLDRLGRTVPAIIAQAAVGAAAVWILSAAGSWPLIGTIVYLLAAAGLVWSLGAAIATRIGTRTRPEATTEPVASA